MTATQLPRFELVMHDGSGRRFDLREGAELTVGAAAHCAIRLTSSDVSRRHALVSVRRGRVVVIDLGSKNGTFVNGDRLAAETELAPGDTVCFSSVPAQVLPAEAGGAGDGDYDALGAAPGAVPASLTATGERRVAVQENVADLLARWAEPDCDATSGLVDWLASRCGMVGAAVVELVDGALSVAAVSGAMVDLLPRAGQPAGLELPPSVGLGAETVAVTLGDTAVIGVARRGQSWVLLMPGAAMLDQTELDLVARLATVARRLDQAGR